MIMEKNNCVDNTAYLRILETAKIIAQLNVQKAKFCVLEKWILKLAVMDKIFVMMVVSISQFVHIVIYISRAVLLALG